jgi:CubicO group peptidase (beta-lactamase class C family)
VDAVVICALLVAALPRVAEARQVATTTEGLRAEIESILAEGRTAAASVAVLRRGDQPWVAGSGVADVAGGRRATAETLFRIGSVSKHFVALAILMLVERGRLSLDDPIHASVPEVAYENRWRETNPVRVVHLLEHATGWDDIHLREYAKDGSTMSLRDALDYGARSRVSRLASRDPDGLLQLRSGGGRVHR